MSSLRLLLLLCLLLLGSCITDPTSELITTLECYPRADWFNFYEVSENDTPELIAAYAHSTVAALIAGNCLLDASEIHAGLVLRVPHPIVSTPKAWWSDELLHVT